MRSCRRQAGINAGIPAAPKFFMDKAQGRPKAALHIT